MSDLRYRKVAEYYSRLEAITGRIEMTEIFASLLRETPHEDLPMLVYLTQGKLRPDYEGVELGIAEKLALKVVSVATGLPLEDVHREYVKHGDIGSAAEVLLERKQQGTLFSEPLTLKRVYDTLMRVAKTTGQGSVEAKQKELVSLLNDATPLEARYIMRTVTGELRLGLADYTILDAFALAFLGSKDARAKLERAYNLHPDMGYIARKLADKGLDGIEEIKIVVGIPVRPMLAERLESAKAIMEKLGNREVAAEYKLDGERLQIHKKGNNVVLFSRRLEVITNHYPDAVELILKCISVDSAIAEAEVVAINEDTGEYLPFQELMHRRRKYGIEEAVRQYPVALNFFDLLLADGEDYTDKPYMVRRKKLEEIIKESERAKLVPAIFTSSPDEIERFMEEAISNGCEGLVVKDIESNYRAGAREFAWIKLKREYRSELTDTLDLVIIGGFYGKGRRAGTFGTYLLAAYDDSRDVFTSIAKIGTGFTDEDLKRIPELLEDYKSDVKPANVESNLEPDVWFKPHLVIETIASEITLSPVHTAAMGRVREGSGLSLRFPKFTGRIRDDKRAKDATTVDEIVKMYQGQIKRVSDISK